MNSVRWSIGRKFLMGLMGFLAFVLVAGLTSRAGLKRSLTALRYITDSAQPMSAAAYEMEINLVGMGFGVLGYFHDRDPIHLERIADDNDDFNRASTEFEALRPEEDATTQEILRNFRNFEALTASVVTDRDELWARHLEMASMLEAVDAVLDDSIQAGVDLDQPGGRQLMIEAMEIEINVNGLAKGLVEYLMTGDARFIERMTNDEEDVRLALQGYSRSATSPAEQRWARQIEGDITALVGVAWDIVAMEQRVNADIARLVEVRRELDGLFDEGIQTDAMVVLRDAEADVERHLDDGIRTALLILGIGLIGGTGLGFLAITGFTRPIGLLANAAEAVAGGDLTARAEIRTSDEIGDLAAAFNEMVAGLGEARRGAEEMDWLKTGLAQLEDSMRGDPDLATLASNVISEMAAYLDVQVGGLYLAADGNGADLSLLGSYAYTERKDFSNRFTMGEGLVGQAALEKRQILVKNVPEDYVKVTSSLGEHTPNFICLTPFLYEDRIKGVVEIGALNEMTDQKMEYLAQAMPARGVAVQSAESRVSLAKALEDAQKISQRLQEQQEELRATNEELEEQAQLLKESEGRLKAQQEEMTVQNEELEE
ncbi:MAG: HAMP domain-containing protein [Candidatus Thermoplasmatota archaeon]|nr:HAMP domain-containing protein [Candidatus Thermoplasmatota archaeon]